MIYVIDHEDSFTFNLVHLLEDFAPTYVSNYYDINWPVSYTHLRAHET